MTRDNSGKAGNGNNHDIMFYLRLCLAVIGVILAVIIARTPPPAGLGPAAMRGLAVFVCTVIWWAANILPDFVTGILMCTAWVVFGAVNFTTAFSGFATDNVWLLIGAFGLAAAVSRTGLLRRISLFFLNLFPPSYRGQVLGLMASGTIITPLIPSSSAKIAVVAPIVGSIRENMGYAPKSQGAGGLFAAMFLSLGTLHPWFLSGSFMCYAVLGLVPASMRANISWMEWFINALPWGLTVFILGCIAIFFLYRPEEKKILSPDLLKQQRAALGPMTTKEKISAVVLVACLLLWMTERMHGISSGVVGVIALCVLLGFNVLDRQSFKSEISWDAVMFIGCIYTVSTVFKTLAIDSWVGKVVGPYVTPWVEGNILVFLIVLCIVIYLVRFLLASQLATITIFSLLLIPLAAPVGIHPWVIAFTTFVAINVWILMYQNAQYLVAFYASEKGEMVTHGQTVKLCLAYMVASIIGLLISVPVWKLTGMLQ